MRLFTRAGFVVLAFFLFLLGCSKTSSTPSSQPDLTKGVEQTQQTIVVRHITSLPKSEVLFNNHGALQPAPEVKKEVRHPQNQLIIFQGSPTKKKVALTFDDGPDRHYTIQILDILKREHVPATFFVVGRMAERYPDVLQRIDQEGHVIGNHSWNHPQLTKLSKAKVDFQIKHTNEVIKQVIGKEPLLLRPPYGSMNYQLAKDLNQNGFKVINWSVDTLDWKKRTPDTILSTVKKQVRPGGIILQHNAGGPQLRSTVKALPDIIAYLKENHYEFVTVDQLLDVPAYRKTP